MIVLPDFIPCGQNTPRIFRYVVDIADVVIKMRTRLSHTVEVFSLEQWPLKTLTLLRLVELPISERQRRLESVFYLPAVPVARRFVFVIEPVFFGESADLVF